MVTALSGTHAPVPGKKLYVRRSDTRERRIRLFSIIAVATVLITVGYFIGSSPDTIPILARTVAPAPHVVLVRDNPDQKRLIFYNRPPKTGSTTIRIAFKNAMKSNKLTTAHCFNMIEWNEMALKTIINRRNVDFYGCHTRVTSHRYEQISSMRGGNVTFVTSTRDPKNIVLSAYLQHQRDRNIHEITDQGKINEEVKRYKKYVDEYPLDALYKYHGADYPLSRCPVEFNHVDAMRRVAERYEAVVDLERPAESAAMVEAVTGLKVNFGEWYNVRSMDTKSPMVSALAAVDTSHRMCGNQLVHSTLKMQFNIIKDRLMQNRCFTEETADFALCEKAKLALKEIKERNREDSFLERNKLIEQR